MHTEKQRETTGEDRAEREKEREHSSKAIEREEGRGADLKTY